MKKIGKLLAALALASSAAPSHAAVIRQEFVSEWTIAVWDYYGDIAAQWWRYQPYTPWDPSLGTLQKVLVTTEVTGSKDVADALRIRYALFTGWSPNQYQLSRTYFVGAGESTFSQQFEHELDRDRFVDRLYLPQANYYFDSRSAKTHTIKASTTLSYQYEALTEVSAPAGWSLLLAGTAALMMARRMKPGRV